MTLSTVSWRQGIAAVAATLMALMAVIVVVRADGLPAVDAASARATAWFVHTESGRIVLVDGYGGRALASLDSGTGGGEQLSIAEGGPGAYVLNDTTGEAQAIDSVQLRLGTPFGLGALGAGRAISGVGQAGLVVVNPTDDEANVVPADGEPIPFAVDSGSATQIAPDGSVWSLVDGDLVRTTSKVTQTTRIGVDGSALLSLVGNLPLVVDVTARRARLGTGSWQALPTTAAPSEILAQVSGPPDGCGWVGAGDDLWCVATDGVRETATVPGLQMNGSDILAISGDAAALVRRGPNAIVRFDWRQDRILTGSSPSVASDATLNVTATVDLVWIDEVAGDFVYGVNPWGITAVDKNAQGILVLGADGAVTDAGESGQTGTGAGDGTAAQPEIREPDDNGIDDPPVAVDDPVKARAGASVSVQVTANDYDPDGEAIAVSSVGVPGHGSVDIGTATTVVYTPEAGYVGTDRFEYTIVDGDGTPATASVLIELLAQGSTNQAPTGVPDDVQTGPGVPVIVDVLLNDLDPERDALRIGGFSPPQTVGEVTLGEVTETKGPSGLPALRFAPTEGFEGTAVFTYRPVDALGAVGQDVEVRVEVARQGDPNRPPTVQPDAVRLRRNVTTPVPVLVNDADPDGDTLSLAVIEPLPGGIEVDVQGENLVVTARAGAPSLAPFEYTVDDGHGHVVRGSVLVSVIDDVEPNRPPVVTADSDKVVAGQSVVVDVTSNDTDPDGDPLAVVAVTQPDDGSGQAVVFSRSKIQFTPSPLLDEEAQTNAKFSYTVSDGNGHQVVGEVTITVLPEPLEEPPFARDDSTFTFVDVPVTIDVLRNDGDPSGGRPSLVGRPGCPAGGTATLTADGQVRFDPPDGQSGAFRCTYEVTNAKGLRASASIIVSVRIPAVTNQPPVANPDFLSVEVGATGSIDVIANDTDKDGGPTGTLTLVSSTAPVLGQATRSGNTITFVAGSQVGIATINYQVADAEGAVSLGYLQVRITERINLSPNAVSDTLTIFGPGTPQQFTVLANDVDPDNTPGGLSVVSAVRVSGDATVSLTGSVVTVSPAPNFIGQVIASYTIRDGGGLQASSSIVLTVLKPLNRPPDARDDGADVVNGGSTTVSVLLNDTDPDGNALSVSIISAADSSLGSTSINANRISFSANPGATGTAVIVYQVSDGELTDTATLRINVLPCAESSPVAGDAFLKTGYQQPIAVDLNSFGTNGTIFDVTGPPGYANGVYVPPAGENGNVVISYSVVNSCRLRANGRITIDVNQVPLVSPKSIALLRGDQAVVPVTDIATDAEALTITSISNAPEWVANSGDRLVVAPPSGATLGASTFSATVTDPGGLSSTVNITVTVQNRPPVAVADTVDVSDGGARTVDLVANDTDADSSGALMIIELPGSVTFPNGEVATIVAVDGRSITITPGAAQGTATFPYRVRDADGGLSDAATVTVIAASPPPTTTTTTTTTTTVPPTTTAPSTTVPVDTTPATTTATTTVTTGP